MLLTAHALHDALHLSYRYRALFASLIMNVSTFTRPARAWLQSILLLRGILTSSTVLGVPASIDWARMDDMVTVASVEENVQKFVVK